MLTPFAPSRASANSVSSDPQRRRECVADTGLAGARDRVQLVDAELPSLPPPPSPRTARSWLPARCSSAGSAGSGSSDTGSTPGDVKQRLSGYRWYVTIERRGSDASRTAAPASIRASRARGRRAAATAAPRRSGRTPPRNSRSRTRRRRPCTSAVLACCTRETPCRGSARCRSRAPRCWLRRSPGRSPRPRRGERGIVRFEVDAEDQLRARARRRTHRRSRASWG